MNILILTSQSYADWLNDLCVDYMSEHLIFIIYEKGDFEKFCNSFSYDIGISFMYTHKIPAKEVNTHKWFNFHPGPLPEYKGRNLCYHAIMNGEKTFGTTLHYMDENFDTGEIIDVRRFLILNWWTAEELSVYTYIQSQEQFQEYFPRILAGEEFERKPNAGGTYYKKYQIIEEIPVRPDEPFGQFVRAVTYKQFNPRIDVGGVKYKIVRMK